MNEERNTTNNPLEEMIVYNDDRGHRFDEQGYVGSRAWLEDIDIVKANIVEMGVDAIVNAANEGLRPGGGVCGAVFENAGFDEMQTACNAIGHCDPGSAVITPGFALKAKYVIHAVGPIWQGGNGGEAELLESCYTKALDLAAENGCASIAFPLISSGIYGYPKKEAWRIALMTCVDWLYDRNEHDVKITFCVMSNGSLKLAEEALSELGFPRKLL